MVRVDNVNAQVMRECREQMGLSLDEVALKVRFIADIESGKNKPTFKQLDTLATLYKVPRWVFISDELPARYNFANKITAFRQFSERGGAIFNHPQVRGLVARVQNCRDLIIELQEDAGNPLTAFDPPSLASGDSVEQSAGEIRKWLDIEDSLEFPKWKESLERKGIFIFMTSKYKGWSHVDKNLFRGLAIHYSVLPIIIINDSDDRKAQSFTLFHELGHLIRKEHALDSWSEPNKEVEQWCDKLAAAVLMPTDQFLLETSDIKDLQSIKKLASKFQASPYACLVRLRNLKAISQATYSDFEKQLREEYENSSQRSGGPPRNRANEVLNQYGTIYINAVFQAYHNEEINLHQLCKSFDLKRVSQIRELESRL